MGGNYPHYTTLRSPSSHRSPQPHRALYGLRDRQTDRQTDRPTWLIHTQYSLSFKGREEKVEAMAVGERCKRLTSSPPWTWKVFTEAEGGDRGGEGQAGRQAGRTQEGGGRWAVDLNIYNAAAAAAASDSLLLRKLESSVSRMLPQPPPCIVRHRLRWKFVIKTYYMYKENERG